MSEQKTKVKKQNIPIKEAAEIMGKSQQFVRLGLQRGELPFGKAIKMSSLWTYHISPKLFYEYLGINSCLDEVRKEEV
ncbi:hypothetical protein [Petroclostridium sp. X23]|uniref:hypothetical protein n=1 Tax=Petroclostridium sp. X23 TaxID=3045146 RepID=UPI0024AD83CA|nr:hypothetical protein [Petroclostridium sp. X23]WHH60405.1 hypothetical protein QKW49_06685 [Petroclostridium sp. X23]